MIKIFLEYKDDIKSYWNLVENSECEQKGLLVLLFWSFNKYRDWITIEERDDNVYIWINFDEDDYDTWEEIPKLILSKQNYEVIVKTWNENAKNPTNYLVFIRNDNGWVKLEPKSKLSEDDLQAIEEDKKEKIEYENRK